MLPRQNRLPASVRLKSAGFYKTSLFTVRFAKNELPYNRYSFVVRKALDKRAVYRNRMRRVFRSCIEEMLEQICQGYDMLFLLEKGIIGISREEQYKEIEKFLIVKHLICKQENSKDQIANSKNTDQK